MVTVDKVDPVRVEKEVRDKPGTLIVLAFKVETVSVEASVMLFPEKVDAVTVDAVNELPVSVEKKLRDRPGTLMVDAFKVETVSVELMKRVLACMVDPWREEKLINWPFNVDTLDTLDVIVDVTNVEVSIELVAITLTPVIFVVPMVDP